MAKIIGITEHFQHFVAELQESFWGDLQARTQQAAQRFFDALSERQPLHGEPALRALGSAPGLPQRILRTRFRDQVWHPAVAGGAHPQARFSARGGAEVSDAAVDRMLKKRIERQWANLLRRGQ